MSAQLVAVVVASLSQVVVATLSQVVVAKLSQVVVATWSQVVSSVAAAVVALPKVVVRVVAAVAKSSEVTRLVVVLVAKASEDVGFGVLDNEIDCDERELGLSKTLFAAILPLGFLREVLVEGAVRRPLATEDRAVWSPVVSVIMAAIAIFGSS